MRFKLLLMAFSSLLSGCFDFEAQLDLDPGTGPDVLVLHGFVKAGAPATVQISSTQSVLSGNYPFFPHEAVAVLYANGVTPYDTLRHSFEKYYGSRPLYSGTNYELRVAHSGFATASVDLQFPEKVMMADLETTAFLRTVESIYQYYEVRIDVSINDPAGEQFYMFEIAAKGDYSPDFQIYPWETQDPDFGVDFSNESDLRKNLPYGLFRDLFFDGKQVTLSLFPAFRFPSSEAQQMDLRVRLYSISKPYFEYLLEVHKQQSLAGNPFTEPVEITGNVRNGLGALGGFQSDEITIPLFITGGSQ